MNNLNKYFCLLTLCIIFSFSVNGASECPIFKVQFILDNNITLNGYTKICGGDTDYVNRGMSFLDYIRNSYVYSNGVDTLIVYDNLYFLKPINCFTFSRDEGTKISIKQIKDAKMISVVRFNLDQSMAIIFPLPSIKEINNINQNFKCKVVFNFDENSIICGYMAISCNPSINEDLLKDICSESKKRYLNLFKSKKWDNNWIPEKIEIDGFNKLNYKNGIFLYEFCDED
jgi:hypothetical protein